MHNVSFPVCHVLSSGSGYPESKRELERLALRQIILPSIRGGSAGETAAS